MFDVHLCKKLTASGWVGTSLDRTTRILVKSCPCRRLLGFGLPAVKDIIHGGEQAPGHPISRDQYLYQLMGKGAGMTPWAYPHTNVAARQTQPPAFLSRGYMR